MIKVLVSFILIGNMCYAQDATWLNQKDSAPFDGYLIKEERVKELTKAESDNKYNSGIIESLKASTLLQESIIQHKDNQINMLLSQNDHLAQVSNTAEHSNTLEKVLIFAAGALAMYGAVKLGIEVVK